MCVRAGKSPRLSGASGKGRAGLYGAQDGRPGAGAAVSGVRRQWAATPAKRARREPLGIRVVVPASRTGAPGTIPSGAGLPLGAAFREFAEGSRPRAGGLRSVSPGFSCQLSSACGQGCGSIRAASQRAMRGPGRVAVDGSTKYKRHRQRSTPGSSSPGPWQAGDGRFAAEFHVALIRWSRNASDARRQSGECVRTPAFGGGSGERGARRNRPCPSSVGHRATGSEGEALQAADEMAVYGQRRHPAQVSHEGRLFLLPGWPRGRRYVDPQNLRSGASVAGI